MFHGTNLTLRSDFLSLIDTASVHLLNWRYRKVNFHIHQGKFVQKGQKLFGIIQA